MKIKLDLHMHSEYSHDSKSRIKSIIKRAKKIGLDGIAITDHEEFKGAQLAAEKAKDIIIIKGQEIDTEYGDIIGLFLKKKINTKKFLEVVSEIKKQKGIVVLPHPARFHILTEDVLREIDLVEIFNARVGRGENEMAKGLANKIGKFAIAGSDAHFLFEIGNGITILEVKDKSTSSLKNAMLKGNIEIRGHRSNKFLRGFVFIKKILGRQ